MAVVRDVPFHHIRVLGLWELGDFRAAHSLLTQGLLKCFPHLEGFSVSFRIVFAERFFEFMFLEKVEEIMVMISSQLARLQEVAIGCLAEDESLALKIEEVVCEKLGGWKSYRAPSTKTKIIFVAPNASRRQVFPECFDNFGEC